MKYKVNSLTEKLLRACKKEGYRFVAIGETWGRIKASKNFPFGPNHSIFCSPNIRRRRGPAIWEIAKEVGIITHCGNSQQIQYSSELTEGKYDLKNL